MRSLDWFGGWHRRAMGVAACAAVLGLPAIGRAQDEFEWDYDIGEGWELERRGERDINWYDTEAAMDYEYNPYVSPTDDSEEFNRRRTTHITPQDEFAYGDDWDYGWHYNPQTSAWEYGWHYNNFGTTGRRPQMRTYDRTPTAQMYTTGTTGQFRVEGEIEQLYSQNIGGEQRWIALIETDDGQNFRIDLGPRDQRLNFTEGSHVTVLASRDAIRGGSMIVADRISQGGQTYRVGDPFARGGSFEVCGEIEDLYTRRMNGETQLVARIDTDEGRKITAVLGPQRAFRNVRLDEGDEVAVYGAQARVQGQRMFVAREVRTDDNRMVRVAEFTAPGEFIGRRFRGDDSAFERERISGEILDLRYRPHRDHTHVIATIETPQGRTIQADLGMESALQQVDLREGDRVVLTGQFGSLEGRNMFKTARLQAQGQTINVQRTGDFSFEGSSGQREVMPVRGKIISTHTQNLGRTGENQLIAKVQMDNGLTKTVVLGPTSQLQQLDLQSGDRVMLLAADNPAGQLEAREIHTQGQVITVRSGM